METADSERARESPFRFAVSGLRFAVSGLRLAVSGLRFAAKQKETLDIMD